MPLIFNSAFTSGNSVCKLQGDVEPVKLTVGGDCLGAGVAEDSTQCCNSLSQCSQMVQNRGGTAAEVSHIPGDRGSWTQPEKQRGKSLLRSAPIAFDYENTVVWLPSILAGAKAGKYSR